MVLNKLCCLRPDLHRGGSRACKSKSQRGPLLTKLSFQPDRNNDNLNAHKRSKKKWEDVVLLWFHLKSMLCYGLSLSLTLSFQASFSHGFFW